MKCKIFNGDITTVEHEINYFLHENCFNKLEIISVNQLQDYRGNLVITLFYR
jgi:hypothetical protein